MNDILEQDRLQWEQDEADNQRLWERYKLLSTEAIDYLRVVLSFTIFFYGITGAIISHALANPDLENLPLAFLIPGGMGVLVGGAYIYFGFNCKLGNEELERIASKIFGYTKKEDREIAYLNTIDPYASMSAEERDKVYKDKYGIDGGYMYRTMHALQTALFVLGALNILIGGFCFWLFCTFKTPGYSII